MKIEETWISGLKVLTPKRFSDVRGFFAETWNKRLLAEHGIDLDFVQDNYSLSTSVNTIRGLHFQAPPHTQAKLVRCGRGRAFDVAVDIRLASPTYGKWFGVELSFENGRQLLVPAGFLHGFATREPDTEIIYKCTAYYEPTAAGVIRFDDPDLDVDWGLSGPPVLSDNDKAAPFLRDLGSPFVNEG